MARRSGADWRDAGGQELRFARLLDYRQHGQATFQVGWYQENVADFCVASGIFNVKFDFSDTEWCDYMFRTLGMMARVATKRFAFNCLTAFADPDRAETILHESR
jgi:hypothetical protein